jgi:hypothetical protein
MCATTALPLGAREAERLAIRVSPAVSFAPANLVVRVMVATDADNRGMEIIAESQEFYRSSEIQLDGDRAPRTTTFEFRSLPPGAYEVTATLLGPGGQERACVHQQVAIISTGAGN